MRALLVANPNATTASPRTRDVLATALANEAQLTVEHTKGRGHATDLARHAAESGSGLIVAFGGDGTVNEVTNGIRTADVADAARPLLGVVPGGSTNVFARALGLPRDPVDATGALLEALREERHRTVGLGRAGERWFTFCAGFGFDAEVVRRVERARRKGKTSTGNLYLRLTLAQFFSSAARRGAHITLSLSKDGHEKNNLDKSNMELFDNSALTMAIIQNASPWTYLGDRAINPSPEASFDSGLDLFALRSMSLARTSTAGFRLLTGRKPAGEGIVSAHDLSEFRLTADRPLAVQVDGEYIGETTEIEFTAMANALRVAV